jgi:hypothetical protein
MNDSISPAKTGNTTTSNSVHTKAMNIQKELGLKMNRVLATPLGLLRISEVSFTQSRKQHYLHIRLFNLLQFQS